MAFLAPIALAGVAGGGASFLGAGLTTALAVGSSVLTGVGAIQQGHYQAAVAKNNAQIAEQNAVKQSEAAQKEGVRSDREYAVLLGEQFASQGASGFDVLGRSQLATRDVTRRVGREAGLDIRDEGTSAARRLLADAANFRAEGKQAKTQGYISGVGSFMGAGAELGRGMGWNKSLVSSRRGGRRPWDQSPDWYRRG